MGRALISYGVDVYRVKKILRRDPDGLLEDMFEDDASWFTTCDREHRALIELGAPTSREAIGHILHGEPFDVRGGPIYVDAALLLCEYVGQRLPSSPYKRGIPWDDAIVAELDQWFDARGRRPQWFDLGVLTHHALGLLDGLAKLCEPGAGWLDAERCEQLDAFFSTLHDASSEADDEERDDREFDEEDCWDEPGLSAEAPDDDALRDVVKCLESWVLTCRERGWALATFTRQH